MIIQELMKMEKKPKNIEFVCLNEHSKAMYMETVNNNSEDIKNSFTSSQSLAESNYY